MGLLCASGLLHDVLLQDAVVLVQLHLVVCGAAVSCAVVSLSVMCVDCTEVFVV